VALTRPATPSGPRERPEYDGLLLTLGGGLPAPRRRKVLTTRPQKAIAGLVVAAALWLLVWRGLTSALDYYLTANQAVAQRAQLGDSDFRIQGIVLPGLRQHGDELYFTVASHKVQVHVVSTGSPPQLFRVGVPGVLVGHWQATTFSSFQILVLHGANYVEAHRPAK
jgi:cytochrome c-type biogenesis protein CcmE